MKEESERCEEVNVIVIFEEINALVEILTLKCINSKQRRRVKLNL